MKNYLVPTFTLVMFWFLPATLYAQNDGPLLPVEIDVQRCNIPSGNSPTWMTQSGIIRDVVAVWDVDDSQRPADRKMDWIKIRVKLGGITDASQLPPGTIKWHIPSHANPSDNTLETPELRWPGNFTIKSVLIEVGGSQFKVHIDVPDVGDLTQAEWTALQALRPGGLVAAAAAWLNAQIADTWASSQTQFSESRRDALEHSYWMSLCASDILIGANMALLLGVAHEHENKAGGISTPFESTMDLHNNWIGTTVVHPWDLTGSTIKAELITKLGNGTLWIWDHPVGQFSGIRAVKRSDDKPIFPPP